MSFTSEIKNELCRDELGGACCQKAECYGFLLFTKLFSLQKGVYRTEHGFLARKLTQDIGRIAGVIAQQDTVMRRKTSIHTVSIVGANERERLLFAFGHTGYEPSLRINYANLENECCTAAFLRGAFLASGAVSDPYKEYHMEFVSPHLRLGRDLITLISNVEEPDFDPALAPRKGYYVIYGKESERIADFLVYLGAVQASMALMQAKMLKEIRNYVNRKTNFETANIDKTISASLRQQQAIRRLLEQGGEQGIPHELRELAHLRLENPEMTLRELGEQLHLSRSGVNHQLKKLVQLANELGREA